MDAESYFRAVVGLVLTGALAISGFYLYQARKTGGSVRREDKLRWVYFARLVAALIFLPVTVLYLFNPSSVTWARISLPPVLRTAGAFISSICVVLFWWVFRSLGKNATATIVPRVNPEIVCNGPYQWVRHPLYASALLMIGALGLAAENWLMLLYAAAGWPIFRFLVVPAEEKYLLDVFGEKYRAYREKTGAMLPRLFN